MPFVSQAIEQLGAWTTRSAFRLMMLLACPGVVALCRHASDQRRHPEIDSSLRSLWRIQAWHSGAQAVHGERELLPAFAPVASSGTRCTDSPAAELDVRRLQASKHGLPVVNRLMGDIEALIVRSLLACQPVIIQDRHCFELYGYDVLWDE
jgi:hypothetical protein